ncbi:hypothetical protein UFOVP41_15 [uncultured Caudovirales phage]|uniref:Uncharacterized protein n=1 Tax=uncultured Caudovirales phage TaxID=2100421 RepID=A0A6J5KQ28_9CAUD|nr:hypothetical protein UFOVP41_15 [uncultured Caudovirales phage]
MGKMDSMKGVPSTTGATAPKGATSADTSGERNGKLVGGVAMGMEDMTGADKQFNTGRTAGVCYEHTRSAYRSEDKDD